MRRKYTDARRRHGTWILATLTRRVKVSPTSRERLTHRSQPAGKQQQAGGDGGGMYGGAHFRATALWGYWVLASG